MPTLCHIADCHLGYRRFSRLTKTGQNQREADVNAAFHEAVTKIISCKPDLVVIAGDLFHSPRPSNAIITFAFRELSRLANGTKAPVVIIAGNHDSPKRVDTGSLLRLFAEIENVYVADVDVEVFNFPEKSISVCAVPYRAALELDNKPLYPKEEAKHNIAVLHGQVKASNFVTTLESHFALDSIHPHQWDYVALGHFHQHREITLNTFYSGATERTTSNIWAEENIECGFIEYDLSTKKKQYHKLTCVREVVNLPLIDATNLSADQLFSLIKEKSEQVYGKLVRLQVENIDREVLKQLPFKEIRAIKAEALGFIIDYILSRRTSITANETREGVGSLESQLEQFISGWQGEQKNLGALLKHYLQKVTERDEARTS